MKFNIETGLADKPTDCLITCMAKGALSSNAKKIDQASKGYLTTLLKQGDLPKAPGHLSLLHYLPEHPKTRLLLFSWQESVALFERTISQIITTLSQTGVKKATLCIADFPIKEKSLAWKIRYAIQIIEAERYHLDDFKSQKRTINLNQITFLVPPAELAESKKALKQGQALCQGLNTAKRLADLPANICTPTHIAKTAKQLAKQNRNISVTVLEEKEMAALKMNLLLSVTAGSSSPAKLIILNYQGGKKAKPIALVGKGITFDTGGNSLKTSPHMIGMKYDMCGAATVLGVIEAAAKLALPLNLVGVIPSCENMPGPNATRPDDIVISSKGLSVEILNTDAEGRLILADALTYCERFDPALVIDIATLTGGCAAALGPYASGLMGNDPDLTQALLSAGETAHDRAWPLPLWDEYHDALKSEFADLANIPLRSIGASTIVAGCFLAKFTEKFRWAHLDIAGTAYHPQGKKRGATGRPIPLLVQYLLDYGN